MSLRVVLSGIPIYLMFRSVLYTDCFSHRSSVVSGDVFMLFALEMFTGQSGIALHLL